MDLARYIDLSMRYEAIGQREGQRLPGLIVYRRDAVSAVEALVYQPAICLVLQGAKMTSIGDQAVELTPGDALLLTHDLTVVSRITRASVEAPYLALILALDPRLIRSLHDEVADKLDPGVPVRPLSAGPADPAWVDPLIRYLEFMDSPLDAGVLGPATLREVHYRLLLSPLGGMLRTLLVADSHACRIARAIQRLRNEFRSGLSVQDLAKTAGMSPSSFHDHFKAVTGRTPLQYLKDLRLIEARTLLLARESSVSAAAYAVGYESPTHFSRDYSRKYGVPPSRDARGVAPTGA